MCSLSKYVLSAYYVPATVGAAGTKSQMQFLKNVCAVQSRGRDSSGEVASGIDPRVRFGRSKGFTTPK